MMRLKTPQSSWLEENSCGATLPPTVHTSATAAQLKEGTTADALIFP